MNWLKKLFKTEEQDTTSDLVKMIETNPPAREIALANKARIDEKEKINIYKSLINEINLRIKLGDLDPNIALFPGLDNTDLLNVARKLKTQGFTIKIRTSKNRNLGYGSTFSNFYTFDYNPHPPDTKYKYLYISWK